MTEKSSERPVAAVEGAGRATWAWVIVLTVGCAVPGAAALLAHPRAPSADEISLFIVGVVTGVSFVGSGLTAWTLRPANGTGRMMVAIGLLVLLSGVQYLSGRVPLAVGNTMGIAALAVLAHVVLVVPEGRAAARAQRAIVVSAYVVHGLVLAVWLRFGRTPEGDCVCLRTLPDLPGRPSLTIAAICLWAYALLLAGTLLRRWLFGLPEPRRHVFAPVALAGVPAVLVLGAREGLSLLPADPPEPLRSVLDTVALFLLVLWPLGLLAGFVRVRLDQAAVGALADRLGAPTAPRSLETSLGVVLHDPTLRLVYRLGDSADFVDGDEQPVSLPLPGSGRSVTPLRGSGEPAAVLIHDAGLDAEPELVRSAAAVARLVLDNERMRAELAGRLEEVRASRARIVEAAAAERRRIERNLHDGAQQRLVALAFVIGRIRARLATGDTGPGAAADLDEAAEELRAAIEEVRELARGIHPSILSEAGLGPALTSLAERSAAPVTVLAAPEDRLPEGVEEAVYFVAAEAVANALKHAGASRITIAVAERDGRLTVEVADDGAGGADPDGGTGLLGLSDRVAALGGRLTVQSPRAAGTRVVAELPVRAPDPG